MCFRDFRGNKTGWDSGLVSLSKAGDRLRIIASLSINN